MKFKFVVKRSVEEPSKIAQKDQKESNKIKIISLYEQTPKLNFRPQINLKIAQKGQKGSKGFQQLKIKKVRKQKVYKMKVINLYE